MTNWDGKLKEYGKLAAKAGVATSGLVLDVYAANTVRQFHKAHAELVAELEALERK